LRADKSPKHSGNGLISLSNLTKYFIHTVPKIIAKYQVLAQRCLCQVRWDIDKSERVEGQASLHTADLLTDQLCPATVYFKISK